MNARMVFETQVRYIDAGPVLLRFAAIDLEPDIIAFSIGAKRDQTTWLTICEDTAAENPPGSGILQRTVKILYSADFVSTFPEDDDRRQALKKFGLQILRKQLPGDVNLNLDLTAYSANDCPP
jgi:hypothetical protein